MSVSKLSLASLALFVLLSGQARAAVTLTMVESGSDVIISGGGTANLAGLTYLTTFEIGGTVVDPASYLTVGSQASFFADLYEGLAGPNAIGPASIFSFASSGSGDHFGIDFSGNLIVPEGYVSGASLTASNTYSGQSFATLGVEPGIYTWTWGTGADADSLRIQVGVPEPGAMALAAVGLLGFGLSQRKRLFARSGRG